MPAKSKKTLFVIQSFDKGADEIYQLIASAAAEVDLTAVRADTIETPPGDSYVDGEIEKALSMATVIVADVTEATPNVMFEIGQASARQKPLILIAKSSRDIPFDLAHFRVVIYETSSLNEFVSRISSAIRQALKHPGEFRSDRPSAQRKQSVFISYSHNDGEYLDRLLVHLKPLEKDGLIELWADTKLRAGDKWKKEIEKALDRANVAVLLVSADFLASDFITENELPPLLRRAEEQGTRVIPLIVKPCRFTRDKTLKGFQAVNDPKKAMVLLSAGEQELVYDQVAAEIERWLRKA